MQLSENYFLIEKPILNLILEPLGLSMDTIVTQYENFYQKMADLIDTFLTNSFGEGLVDILGNAFVFLEDSERIMLGVTSIAWGLFLPVRKVFFISRNQFKMSICHYKWLWLADYFGTVK